MDADSHSSLQTNLILVIVAETISKINLLNSNCQNKKRPHLERALFVNQKLNLALDGRSNHCYWGDFTSGQVEREVVSIPLVHYFHT